MNREEIRNVLLERAGKGLLPDRGVGADDVLLNSLDAMNGAERTAFWLEFGEVLQEVWRQGENEAFLNAAAFVARTSQADRPKGEDAQRIAGFLLDEAKVKSAIWSTQDELRLLVATLRLLAALGLGNKPWWRVPFNSWLHHAETRPDNEALYAWQGVLHASRGLLNSGEVAPNFDAWFQAAQKVRAFPALEVFTLLADQTDTPSADKDSIKEEVLETYQDLYARCLNVSACPQGIQDLKAVIETWLEDRVGMKPGEANCRLEWKEPNRLKPSVRFSMPVEETKHCAPPP